MKGKKKTKEDRQLVLIGKIRYLSNFRLFHKMMYIVQLLYQKDT